MEEFACGDILYWENFFYKSVKTNIAKSIARVLFYICFSSYIKLENNGKVWFILVGDSGKRKDRMTWYKNVLLTCKNYTLIKSDGYKLRFSVGDLTLILSWYKLLRKYFGVKKSFFMMSRLYRYFKEFIQIKRIIDNNINEINLLVAFCDAHPVDNLVIQYCNNASICKSATLQHGISREPGHFFLSRSDYFLGWGSFFQEKAMGEGLSKEKYLCLGMPQLINESINDTLKVNKKKRFAIILSGIPDIDVDSKCMEIAISFGKKEGYGIIVKMHPSMEKKNYKKSIDWNAVELIHNEYSVKELTNMVDFAIVCQSTVFIEYAIGLFPVVLYMNENNYYKEVEWFGFANEAGLKEFANMLDESPEEIRNRSIGVREQFSNTYDIKGKYAAFFSSFQ